MGKDINIGEFKRKLLKENNEPEHDPAKDHFANAEDQLYRRVTGEEPKASSANKFRDLKEDESKNGSIEYILDQIKKDLEYGEFSNRTEKIQYLEDIMKGIQSIIYNDEI